MIVNGYKITPAPVGGVPFRAVVHHAEFHPPQFVFLSRDHCEPFCHYVDMLGEAARAYREWVLEQQTEGSGMIVLEFPYTSPPLTANQRMHWRKKATITRDVRELTGLLANRVPRMSACTVELVWFVNTKHRRDVDNVTPTLKAMCDGLVDANVVTDDTPDLMKKLMPEIVYEKGGIARMELRITEGTT